MYNEYLKTYSPEIIGLLIGFLLRHYIPTIVTSKEAQNLLKYLRNNIMTKDQQHEMQANLAQTQLWMEVHSQSCPYVKKEIREAKEAIYDIINHKGDHEKSKKP